jgi:hypothetical protein
LKIVKRAARRCTKCAVEKPPTDFYGAGNGHLRGDCKACFMEARAARMTPERRRKRAERSRQWALDHPEEIRKHAWRSRRKHRGERRAGHLWERYRLTPKAYDEMLAAQGGVCRVCKQLEATTDYRTGEPRHLAVDHCHETGRIRALLCQRCNTTLGRFREEPALLTALAEHASEECA